MCQSKDYVYELITGLLAWISLDCFVVDLFHLISIEYIQWINQETS